MDDPSREIADLRLDIEALRAVIDATSNGVAAPDALLRACANTLYERYARLARLTAEAVAAEGKRRARPDLQAAEAQHVRFKSAGSELLLASRTTSLLTTSRSRF